MHYKCNASSLKNILCDSDAEKSPFANGPEHIPSTLTNVTGQLLPALSSPFGPFLVASSRVIHSESKYIFHCRYSAMLYFRGRGSLLTRGGTLQQKIEVFGQQLVSPGGNQQIAALSNCEPLSPSAYYHSHSRA